MCSTSPVRRTCRARPSGWWGRARHRSRGCARWTWWSASPAGTEGAGDDRAGSAARVCARTLRLLGNLAVEIDDIAGEKARSLAGTGGELSVGTGRDEVGVTRHGEMRFQAEQRSLGREPGFPLFLARGTCVAV